MHGTGHQFFARPAFPVDQHRSPRVLQARDHAQHFLDPRRGADDAVHRGFRIHALAKKFIFFHQANFIRHTSQEEPQLFERRKRFRDVVVGAQLHRLHGGFDGAVTSHQRNLGPRQELLYLFQKFQARHVRHHHVAQDHVDGLLLEQCQRRLPALRFQADEAQGLADGDAQFANALLVVDDQQSNAEIFLTRPSIHSIFPKVFETTSINCCTRKGFSTQGAPV